MRHIKTLLRYGYSVEYTNASRSNNVLKRQLPNEIKLYHYNIQCWPRKNPLSYILILILISFRVITSDAAIVHIHDMYLLPIVYIARIFGKHVVYDKHEYYETFKGINGAFARWIDSRVCQFIDGVVVVTDGQVQYLQDIGFKNIICIPNYQSRLEFYDSIDNNLDMSIKEKVNFVYFGSLSEADRNILLMLEIMDELLSSFDNIAFELGGEAREDKVISKIDEMMSKYPDSKFKYHGYISHNEVVSKTLNADIGFILFKETPNTINCSPNKIYEYFMTGTMIIAMGGGDAFKQIQKNSCGRVFAFSDGKKEIIEYIIEMIKYPEKIELCKMNSWELGKRYSWESVETNYISLYKNIMCKHYNKSEPKIDHILTKF